MLYTLFKTEYYSFLNFVESKRSSFTIETSRTIIRAASLRPLPGVHVPSINQVVSLGS